MSLSMRTVRRLAEQLNAGTIEAFITAVERLPAADRNALAVLGACRLFEPGQGPSRHLRGIAGLVNALALAAQVQGAIVDEEPPFPPDPEAPEHIHTPRARRTAHSGRA